MRDGFKKGRWRSLRNGGTGVISGLRQGLGTWKGFLSPIVELWVRGEERREQRGEFGMAT